MRCNEVCRLLVFHASFLLFSWLLLCLLRVLVPTIAADHLLHSVNLTTEQLNEQRTLQAQKTINQRKRTSLFGDEGASVEVRILASDRKRGYLTQVIGYILSTFKSEDLPSVGICNVEGREFEELQTFQGKLPIHNIKNGQSDKSQLGVMIKKETADYWKCLQLPTTARYILLLEDDALVVPHFPRLLASLVDQLDDRSHIDYVKLYHPNYLRKLPSVPLAITLSLTSVLLFQWLMFRRVNFFFLLVCILIFYVIVRSFTYQLLADLRFNLTGSAYMSMPESCCTPAVVFRSTTKDLMASELLKEESTAVRAKDHILDESRFVGRQSDTNWVVHIGSFSSVRNREVRLAERYSVQDLNEDKWLRFFL